MKLRFELITTFEKFCSLKVQWNNLAKATGIDHAFMRHEWFESWIRNLMTDSRLVVPTCWDKDKLVAAAPLHIIKDIRKELNLRILSFMKSSVSPRCNFLIDQSYDPTLFFDIIFKIKGWDICELKSVEADNPLTIKFVNYLKKKRKVVVENGIQSPYEMLDPNWESYLEKKSRNFKNNYRKYPNRLKKAGDFEIIKVDNFEDFEEFYELLVEVSGKSWKAKGGTDFKSMPEMANFYKTFSRLGSKDNLFVLYILFVNNKMAAFSYYLNHDNRLAGLRWEYDEEFSFYMPGTVIHNHVIKELMDSGEKWEYDLTGHITEHKAKLVPDIRKHIDITFGSPGIIGNLLIFAKQKLLRSK